MVDVRRTWPHATTVHRTQHWRDVRAYALPFGGQNGHAVAHLKSHQHGVPGGVRARQRVVEDDHDAVAIEALDRALELLQRTVAPAIETSGSGGSLSPADESHAPDKPRCAAREARAHGRS